MKNIQSGQEGKKELINHILALFLLGLMIVIELATTATVSPLISMLCFGFFAYRMRPMSVAVWVVVFSLTSLYFLLFAVPVPGMPIDRTTALIRFWTVIVGGIGAVILSFDRNKGIDGYLQTIRILEELPTPVIISDPDGGVVFMNNDAIKLLDIAAEEVKEASYFSFIVAAEKGKTVQRYFDFVSSNQATLHDFAIQIIKPKPMEIQTTLFAIQGNHARWVATVFPTTLTKD